MLETHIANVKTLHHSLLNHTLFVFAGSLQLHRFALSLLLASNLCTVVVPLWT